MPKDSSYMEYIMHDILGHIDGVSAKSMFSGWGIYLDGVIIGIIAEGEFYMKANKEAVIKYKKQGLYPFTYTGHKGKIHELAYMSVPLETLEDRDKITERVYESFDISKKAKKDSK